MGGYIEVSKRKYKVSFEIEGTYITDDTSLTKENIRRELRYTMAISSVDRGYGSPSSDTKISKIKIVKL